MQMAAKIIPGLVAFMFFFMGVNFMFDPAAGAASFAVEPLGSHGLNTIRGDLGGMFLTCTVLLTLGIWKSEGRWLIAVAILMSLIALGRILGFVVDGEPNQATVTAAVVEVVIALALLYSSARISGAGASTV